MLYTLPSLVILSHQSNRFSLPSRFPIPLPPTFQPASLLTFQRFSPPSEVQTSNLSLFCRSLHQECFTTPFQSSASTLFLKNAGWHPAIPSMGIFYKTQLPKAHFFGPFFSSTSTLFQVPYTVSPLLATLTKTAGVYTNNSHSGNQPPAHRAFISGGSQTSTCNLQPSPFQRLPPFRPSAGSFSVIRGTFIGLERICMQAPARGRPGGNPL